MEKETREVRRFEVKDSNGACLTIVLSEEYEKGNTNMGRLNEGGSKSLKTADGRDVNRIDKGRYEIVGTGEVLPAS